MLRVLVKKCCEYEGIDYEHDYDDNWTAGHDHRRRVLRGLQSARRGEHRIPRIVGGGNQPAEIENGGEPDNDDAHRENEEAELDQFEPLVEINEPDNDDVHRENEEAELDQFEPLVEINEPEADLEVRIEEQASNNNSPATRPSRGRSARGDPPRPPRPLYTMEFFRLLSPKYS